MFTVIFFLPPSPFLLQLMPGIASPDPAELVLFSFLLSSLFLSFFFPYSLKGGSSSLPFFLAGFHLDSYVEHWQVRGRGNSPQGWPGSGLGVSNCRTLVIQMHSDG